MQIVAALFIDDIEMRQVPGPATRIDLRGVQFSAPAPAPFPITVDPHLVVLVHCPAEEDGTGILEVVFTDEAGEPDFVGKIGQKIARLAQCPQHRCHRAFCVTRAATPHAPLADLAAEGIDRHSRHAHGVEVRGEKNSRRAGFF